MTGSALIGFGGGLFTVGTLTECMRLERVVDGWHSGLAVGAWGAVYASSAGLAVAGGALLRDLVVQLGAAGALGPAMVGPYAGYGIVYHLEIVALFLAMAVLGPLATALRPPSHGRAAGSSFGLSELPG